MAKLTITGVVAELDARGFSAWLTADKERYANWGYFDVARACRYIEEQVEGTYNFAAGDASKALTERSIMRVYDKTTNEERWLEPMSDEQWAIWRARDLTSTGWRGAPTQYYIWDEKLWLSPIPDKARTIVTEGSSVVTELAGAGTPLTTQELDPAIVHRALYYCHTRANEPDLAQAAAATAEEVIYKVMGDQGLQMDERIERVEPDTGWGIVY